jgi:hypothetical protein
VRRLHRYRIAAPSAQPAASGTLMLRSSLRSYLPAVLRQWWTYIGIGSGLVGYLLDVFTDLKILPAYWIAGFVVCLTVAQFFAYHEVRAALALRDRGLQIPLWAMHVCNANADGSWLTVLVIGDAPKTKFDTTCYRQLVAAIDQQFELTEESRKVESFADFLRVTVPKRDGGTPELLLQLGAGQHGALCIQARTQADPLPLFWLVQQLDRMMSFLLSEASELVVRQKNREYTLCLSEWPDGGIDTGNLVTAHRLSQNFVRGSRTMGAYKLAKGDLDGWGAIRAFAKTVLANAGYTDFEASLAATTRYSLATAIEAENTKTPHRTS